MIVGIEVNGFKSLRDFKMEIKPGINLLVGPNGSGKTNIISFFELLRDIQEMPVSTAVSKHGGAGALFCKVGEKGFRSTISAKIYGAIQVASKKVINYVYGFEIRLGGKDEFIYFSEQSLRIKNRTVHSKPFESLSDPDLSISISQDTDGQRDVRVHDMNLSRIKFEGLFFVSGEDVPEKITKQWLQDTIKGGGRHFLGSRMFLSGVLRYMFDEVRHVGSDLEGGTVYNIVPGHAKSQDDGARDPGVSSDGSGLYATLYHIKQQENGDAYHDHDDPLFWRMKRIKKTSISKIMKYVQLANPAISAMRVESDPFDNKIQVKVDMHNEEKSVLPLSSMSDGTLKWICLITIILSSESVFSIEEPENYLHPGMQKEIVSIMRNYIYSNKFVLISTHSETILNCARPDEVVIVSFDSGITKARRISNRAKIEKEISKTGFGLGFYYLSGALEGE